ncbi:MAG TPA: hypothetical protein VN375_07790 [Vicinamibacteria bacterium]|jgi:hypothetical protein|nr:hypothetical protein [Vicinamibacteria bacterium]
MSQPNHSAGGGALRSRRAVVLGLSLALALPACKKTTAPTPVATPTPAPARAVVSIAILNFQLKIVEPPPDRNHPGFYNETIYTLHVVESGGVSCNLNFIRLEYFESDGTLLERTEQGPSAFAVGGNRLEAGHTLDYTVFSYFNSDLKKGRSLVYTLGYTDDKGNNGTASSGSLVIG